ncbi:MAG: CBS domain-containing protein [Alkalibacterium sp.]|uniref:CBS domain-containing protein n=2 Tax=Alkalibacterium gilvum TaxID=1130080 RepID=A0A1H6RME2_9LACT|nr:cyclic-di-AMP-binding protein CbpB [Alkalibacterium sp.]MDN6293469.1 CBS domain-containing protein [Alkalibacterium sp.]MDN6386035.1 CBS domain-containing protein [Alkalibacterium sp.]SEI52372.1 CBS domain-containing protein [Alkalibacterium gilvum]
MMIGEKIKKLLINEETSLVKPAEQVAVVGIKNRLNHALLLLTTDKYAVVPVLDDHSKMCGLISMPTIMQTIMDIEDVHFEKLGEIEVGEVMDRNYPYVFENYELEDVLNRLVHHAFITVIDDEGFFKGIITRSEILKGTNRIAHEFERKYEVKEKEAITH